MKIDIIGRNGYVVEESDYNYANKAFLKVSKIFKNTLKSDLTIVVKKVKNKVSNQKNLVKIEASIVVLQSNLRAEIEIDNIRNGFDKVSEKLAAQIRKLKDKITSKYERVGIKEIYNEEFSEIASIEVESQIDLPVISRRKEIVLKPCSLEDAIYEMELLNHDFYLFIDDKTLKVCVLYVRNDGDYAVLEAKI